MALLVGCAQRALNTDINDATIRLLRRHGCEVVIPKGVGCCGALTHHMGKTSESHAMAAATIRALMAEIGGEGLDAVVINTSGCGTTVKDYGHMFAHDALAGDAARVAGLARDITEPWPIWNWRIPPMPSRCAFYHAACSLQHGSRSGGAQGIAGRRRVHRAGAEGQPYLLRLGRDLSSAADFRRTQAPKVGTLEVLEPQVISAGNIGCMMQIGSGTGVWSSTPPCWTGRQAGPSQGR